MLQTTLIPELAVTSFEKSLDFYTHTLGFSIEYQRPEEGFAMLSLGTAQLMIDQIGLGRTWKTGDLEYPLGRGINLQIEVEDIDPILQKIHDNVAMIYLDVEEKWYRKNDVEVGNRQFLVQDPDGYLLRFTEDLGERAIANL